MKKTKSRLLLIVALIFNSLAVYAQVSNTTDGEVMAVISMGQQDYSIIRQMNNDELFKTSPYNSGELSPNEVIDIKEIGNPNTVEIIKPSLNAPIHAHRMVNAGNGILYPPTDRMPVQENGILFFESLKHLYEYQDLVRIYLKKATLKCQRMINLTS